MKKVTSLFFAIAMMFSIVFIAETVSTQAQTKVRRGNKSIASRTYRGGKYVGRKTVQGAKYVGRKTYQGGKYVGKKSYQGGKYATKKTVKGAKYVGKKTVGGTKSVFSKTKKSLSETKTFRVNNKTAVVELILTTAVWHYGFPK